jgi:hypothetical protein
MDHGHHVEHTGGPAESAVAATRGDDASAGPAAPVPGLAVADDRLRLEGEPTITGSGKDVVFTFRIRRTDGTAVSSFDERHERRMHLIVVRRDLTGFQHLHPTMDEDGTWRTRLTLPTGGAWRAFADFATDGTATTLGLDLHVEGEYRPESLPPETESVTTAGDLVSLDLADGGLHRFTVTRDGEPVHVEPYLGARGHLVALRLGDLAFLHVHPVADDPGDIAFAVSYPSAGAYRLFLQYSVEGQIRTAAFTRIVR